MPTGACFPSNEEAEMAGIRALMLRHCRWHPGRHLWSPADLGAPRGIGTGRKIEDGTRFCGHPGRVRFCLVMTGAAFLYSLRNLVSIDTGFDPHGVAVLGISAEIG